MNNERPHWFWGPVLARKGLYAQVIIASIFINLFALVSAFYIMTVYDRVIPNDATESLTALTVGVLVIVFFDFVMKTLRGRFTDEAGAGIDREVGERLFDHLSRNYQLTHQRQVGALATTVREFEQLKEFISSASFTAFADFPFVLLFLWVLWNLGGPIAAVPAMIVVAVVILGIAIHPFIRHLSSKNSGEAQSKQGVLVELLSGMETVKSLPGLSLLRERWLNSVDKQAEQGGRVKGLSQIATNAAQTGQQLCQVGVVAYGVVLIAEGNLTMGSLIACVILGGRTLAPLAQITSLLSRYSQASNAYRALDQLFTEADPELASRQFVRRSDALGSLAFKGVTLSYPKAGQSALNGVDFNLGDGQRLGVLGSIGSGKTSLLRLATGLVPATEGQILVGGIDVRHWHPDDLRRQIAVVSQTPTLFTGSVVENIRLGKPGATDDEVLSAAEIAGVLDFVNQLESGLDTHLFERGAQLSGGQRQAICIARAIVADPKILIMDEPTSALDNGAEQRLVSRLSDWIQGRTLIVMTHRAPMLALVEHLMVLDGGKISRSGPKEQVVKAA